MSIIIGTLLLKIVEIYTYLLIGSVVFSWLIAFNVVNTHNRIIFTIWDFLNRVTEPALRPIRRILPNLGTVDISPVILILALEFLLKPLIVLIFYR
jgi:YggT family protein